MKVCWSSRQIGLAITTPTLKGTSSLWNRTYARFPSSLLEVVTRLGNWTQKQQSATEFKTEFILFETEQTTVNRQLRAHARNNLYAKSTNGEH